MALKVLLADDSVPAQNMGKKILMDAGYEVLAVSNGLEALRKIADHAPDLAILDIFMPGYTGLEVCARLRASAATAELPVILAVGKLEPYRPEDGEQVHSNAVIVKPFAAHELVSAVRSLVGLPFAAPSAAAEASASEPAPVAAPPNDEAPEAFEAAASLPESFAFDPGARRAAFCASVLDEPFEPAHSAELEIPQPLPQAGNGYPAEPAAEPSPAACALGQTEAAFTDFALESSPSALEPAPAAVAGLIEWWQPSPESVGPVEAAAPALELEEPVDAEAFPGVVAEPEAATEPADLLQEAPRAEPDSSSDVFSAAEPPPPPAFGEWEESAATSPFLADEAAAPGQEIAPLSQSTEAAGQPAEDLEAHPEPPTATAQPEREVRMRAFEELFESEVPFPLEAGAASQSCSILTEQQPCEPQQPTAFQSVAMPAAESGSDELELAAPGAATIDAAAPAVPAHEAAGLELAAVPALEQTSLAEPAKAAETASFAGDAAEDAMPAELRPADELQLDAAALADWLATGKLPHTDAPAGQPGFSAPPEPASTAIPAESSLPELAPEPLETRDVADEDIAPAGVACVAPEPEADLPAPEPQPCVEEVASESPHAEEIAAAAQCSDLEPQACEPYSTEAEIGESELSESSVEAEPRNQAERIQGAVQSVFERFRPLLVAAIVRELARRD